MKRLDTPGKVNGSAQFGMDVRLPGMLTAVVARCAGVAGGRGRELQRRQGQGLPGVRHVVADSARASPWWPTATGPRSKGRDALEIQWDEGAGAALSSDGIRKTYA